MSVELAPATKYEEFCRSLRSRGPTLNLLFEQARVSPEREGDTILRDTFAGAIVSVLHGMLSEYWLSSSGTKDRWKRAGTSVAGYSIGQILTAALDNFRHFEQWDCEKPADLLKRRSVKVLCAVLGLDGKKTSKHPPFRGNVCWPALEALSRGGYGTLEALAREFAGALEEKPAT